MELKIEYLGVNDLTPYERNTRRHESRDVDEIVKSIERYGFDDPIGIWSDRNIIVEGHGRLLAAKILGMQTVPVIRLDHLTDEQRREYAIMHNRTAELSRWDFEALQKEMAELHLDDFNFEMDETEITAADFDEGAELEEVAPTEPPKEPKSQRGQIYQLGEHRLMCGDSTNADDVRELMAGSVADLLLTDPPYNVGLGQNGGHPLRPSEAKQLHRRTDGAVIENDAWQTEGEFIHFLTKAFTAALDAMKPGAVFYIWYAGRADLCFRTACINAGMEIRQVLIWNKNTFAIGRQDYQWKHEPCLYGWKEGAAHYFTNSRVETTVIPDTLEIDPEKMKKDELVELVKKIYAEKIATTVIDEKKPTRSKDHPTMKPVGLVGYQMRNSSKRGDIVLDLFGGSGSTLIAAEQLRRRCYMMEYDPRYVDVIIKRWEEYTGKKARLLK